MQALKEKHPLVGDVRGLGLMQALELVKDRKTKEPASEAALAVLEETKRRGVLVGKGGLYGNVVRLGLPLTAGRAQIDELVAALDASLAVVGGR